MTEVKRQVVKFEPFVDAHGRRWEWQPNADYAGNILVECESHSIKFYFNTAVEAQLFCDLILAATIQEPL